jgi:hypothetical protein
MFRSLAKRHCQSHSRSIVARMVSQSVSHVVIGRKLDGFLWEVPYVSSSELQLRHLGLLKLPKDPHRTRWRASCPLHIMSSLTQDLACCWNQAERTLFTHGSKCLCTTSMSRSRTTQDIRGDSRSSASRQAGGSGAPYPPVSKEDTASPGRRLDGETDTCAKSSVWECPGPPAPS